MLHYNYTEKGCGKPDLLIYLYLLFEDLIFANFFEIHKNWGHKNF